VASSPLFNSLSSLRLMDSSFSLFKPWAPVNHETMYMLQLHPIFRAGSAFIFLIFGVALYLAGEANTNNSCGEVCSTFCVRLSLKKF